MPGGWTPAVGIANRKAALAARDKAAKKKPQAASTQNLARSNTNRGGRPSVAAPVSTLASLPQSPELQALIDKGIIKEGMPPEQALAILAISSQAGRVPIDIAALKAQIAANYAGTGNVTEDASAWMQQMMGANAPTDPAMAALYANDPMFSGYAGTLGTIDETAQQNLATDQSWFDKQQQALTDYYNGLLLGAQTGTLLPAAAGGGGGGGGGGRGGRGGGGSSGDGDTNVKIVEQQQLRDAAQQTNQELYPGWEDALRGLHPDDPAYQQLFHQMHAESGGVPWKFERLASQQLTENQAQEAADDLVNLGNNAWLGGLAGNTQNALDEYMSLNGLIQDYDPTTGATQLIHDPEESDEARTLRMERQSLMTEEEKVANDQRAALVTAANNPALMPPEVLQRLALKRRIFSEPSGGGPLADLIAEHEDFVPARGNPNIDPIPAGSNEWNDIFYGDNKPPGWNNNSNGIDPIPAGSDEWNDIFYGDSPNPSTDQFSNLGTGPSSNPSRVATNPFSQIDTRVTGSRTPTANGGQTGSDPFRVLTNPFSQVTDSPPRIAANGQIVTQEWDPNWTLENNPGSPASSQTAAETGPGPLPGVNFEGGGGGQLVQRPELDYQSVTDALVGRKPVPEETDNDFVNMWKEGLASRETQISPLARTMDFGGFGGPGAPGSDMRNVLANIRANAIARMYNASPEEREEMALNPRATWGTNLVEGNSLAQDEEGNWQNTGPVVRPDMVPTLKQQSEEALAEERGASQLDEEAFNRYLPKGKYWNSNFLSPEDRQEIADENTWINEMWNTSYGLNPNTGMNATRNQLQSTGTDTATATQTLYPEDDVALPIPGGVTDTDSGMTWDAMFNKGVTSPVSLGNEDGGEALSLSDPDVDPYGAGESFKGAYSTDFVRNLIDQSADLQSQQQVAALANGRLNPARKTKGSFNAGPSTPITRNKMLGAKIQLNNLPRKTDGAKFTRKPKKRTGGSGKKQQAV